MLSAPEDIDRGGGMSGKFYERRNPVRNGEAMGILKVFSEKVFPDGGKTVNQPGGG